MFLVSDISSLVHCSLDHTRPPRQLRLSTQISICDHIIDDEDDDAAAAVRGVVVEGEELCTRESCG